MKKIRLRYNHRLKYYYSIEIEGGSERFSLRKEDKKRSIFSLIREGYDVQVFCIDSGKDITCWTLHNLILECEKLRPQASRKYLEWFLKNDEIYTSLICSKLKVEPQSLTWPEKDRKKGRRQGIKK